MARGWRAIATGEGEPRAGQSAEGSARCQSRGSALQAGRRPLIWDGQFAGTELWDHEPPF